MKLETMFGQPSWKIKAGGAAAWLTRQGGHLAPVRLRLGRREVTMPLSINPWTKETAAPGTPGIVQVLRGDFFCLPFGLNVTPWKGRRFPVHGETANRAWTFRGLDRRDDGADLRVSLRTKLLSATVEKTIGLRDGHAAVYCRHVIRGLRETVNFGHHAMLHFPPGEGTGLVSAAPFAFGQVLPTPFEEPSRGGYCALKPGARFATLRSVPDRFGGRADLSAYPARAGYEDLVVLASKPNPAGLGWTAVTFPGEGLVWFGLKDPAVLRQTALWHSNGGRHYAPWNGRHTRVLGLEEVTSYFHYGPAEATVPNPHSRRGFPTAHRFDGTPFTVNYLMGMAAVPRGFDHVASVEEAKGGVRLVSRSGRKAFARLDLAFLRHREA